MYVETPTRTFAASSALSKGRRVVLTSGVLAYAGANDDEYGVLENAVLTGDELGTVRLQSAQGTQLMIASGAISAGDRVYGDASGKVSASAVGRLLGIAFTAATADGDEIEVMRIQCPKSKLYAATAASAAVTNTTTETAFDKSYTIPANTLKVGDIVRIRFQGIATGTNSTDTLNLKLKIGSTVLAATGAVDVADNDIGIITVEFVVRTIGASGTFVASGYTSLGANGTATAKAAFLASTAIDTTAAQAITVTATWSVANAGNTCRLDMLDIERIAG